MRASPEEIRTYGFFALDNGLIWVTPCLFEPAVTVNRFGNGKAYYVAARTGDDFLAAFYGRLVADGRLATGLPPGNPAGVHGHLRTDGRRRFLFVYNWSREAVTVDLGAGRYRNLIEGGETTGTLPLPGYGSTVLEQV